MSPVKTSVKTLFNTPLGILRCRFHDSAVVAGQPQVENEIIMEALNHQEVDFLCEKISQEIEGLTVDELFIPLRAHHREGYVRGEWALRLVAPKREKILLFSLRAQHVYLGIAGGKDLKKNGKAKLSAFFQALGKQLRGERILALENIPGERAVLLKTKSYALYLVLIPARPDAFLIGNAKNVGPGEKTEVHAHFRMKGSEASMDKVTLLPENISPKPFSLRTSLQKSLENFFEEVQTDVDEECFHARYQELSKHISQGLEKTTKQEKKLRTQFESAKKDSEWRKYANLLKASLANIEECEHEEFYEITDYETEELVKVPRDPKLTPLELVQKYYLLAKRNERRISEAGEQLEAVSTQKTKLEKQKKKLDALQENHSWEDLEKLEAEFPEFAFSQLDSREKKQKGPEVGKRFWSKEGYPILVGRKSDENLALTFRVARGNDLWLHVRGKPGAHVVIQLPPGKSASLETLLDAANLALYFSNGENWGKTEVDYTFKKYVKRIKDSKEASYTSNKTIIVQLDRARIERLMKSGELP